ncbi:MAG: dephospho-CoA kinase, partial [Phycisphaerae bacterium]
WWGPGVLTASGGPDRSAIAGIVFSDEVERKRLESLIHPLIAAQRVSMIQSVESQPAVKAIVLDSPLLIESKLDRLCDAIIFVHASEAQRLERVTRNRGWGKEEFYRRENQQLSLEQKRARAHYIIENTGTRESLRKSVQVVLNRILADASTHRP